MLYLNSMEAVTNYYFGIFDSILEDGLAIQIVSDWDYANGLWFSEYYSEEVYRCMSEIIPGYWETASGVWAKKSSYKNRASLTFDEIYFIMTSAGFKYAPDIGKMAEENEDSLIDEDPNSSVH